MSINDAQLTGFLDSLASGEPTPGGGGAAAVCGALAAALGSMVCNITAPNPKYADNRADVESALAALDELRGRFLALADADTEAFAPLAKAYGLPKSTPEEIEHKETIMKSALRAAAAPPLDIMRCCCEVAELLELVLEKSSKMVLSDVGVAAALCRAALESASLNVFVNTKLMKDREAAAALGASAEEMLASCAPVLEKIYSDVAAPLKA